MQIDFGILKPVKQGNFSVTPNGNVLSLIWDLNVALIAEKNGIFKQLSDWLAQGAVVDGVIAVINHSDVLSVDFSYSHFAWSDRSG